MDLSTTYLGMRLPHPLIVGAGPLSDDLDMVRALEDAGAAMLVLRSLYEEEITGEQMDAFAQHREPTAIRSPKRGASRRSPTVALGPDEYLEHLRRVKSAVGIPVMASLNGVDARRLDCPTRACSRRPARTASSCTSTTPPAT